jgi:methyl-accepting chemotaxis protein
MEMEMQEPQEPSGDADQSREGSSLDQLSQRLESLAQELEQAADRPDEAASLVREASDLAAEAGREVETALKAASEAREE